ncbi:MAG TPA: type III pantothenate kinase [Acidobacteriaceae bacterium]|nr:type III pantothenate kinase [Acidobacteriaceae bacterium]
MLLALDVGNTNTVLGLYRPPSDQLIAHWRTTTLHHQTSDEYGVLFLNLFSLNKIDPGDVASIIIASVVPPVESVLREVCERYFHIKPIFVEPGIKTGMPILVDNPAELGADRLVNGVAAYSRYGGPCIVVDFGTATTFDVVSARGEYIGGVIAPGIGLSAEALFARAARLSRVDIRKPAKVIGTNTVAHLQSGLYYGYVGLVDGILERILQELSLRETSSREEHAADPSDLVKVIATGGLARMVAAESKYIATIDDMLTLEGLRLVYERNRAAKAKHAEAGARHG